MKIIQFSLGRTYRSQHFICSNLQSSVAPNLKLALISKSDKLPRALSSWALSISKNGDFIICLSNLLHCWLSSLIKTLKYENHLPLYCYNISWYLLIIKQMKSKITSSLLKLYFQNTLNSNEIECTKSVVWKRWVKHVY